MIVLITSRTQALVGLLALAGLVMLGAPSAQAERVTDVRIGRHGEYTRVVIELDAPSGYKLERLERPGEAPEILVKVDASSSPRELASQSDVVKSVKLETKGEGSVARIALRTRDIRLAEMKLTGPSRIVLDVRKASGAGEGDDVASRFEAPATTPALGAPKIAAQPAPAAKPAKKEPLEVPKGAPVTPPPLPATVEAELEAVARGENVLDEEVEAVRGAPKKTAEAVAKPAPAAAPAGPAPTAAVEPEAEAPLGKPVALADAGAPKEASPPPAEAPAAPAQEAAAPAPMPTAPSDTSITPPPSQVPAMADASPRPGATEVKKPVTPPPVIEEGSDSTLWLGVALVALGLIVAWRLVAGRRRAEEPQALSGIPPDAFDDRRATSEGTLAAGADPDEADLDEKIAASAASYALSDEDGDAPRSQSSLFDDEDDGDVKPDAETPTLARPLSSAYTDDLPTIARAVSVDDDLPVVPGLASQAVTATILQPAASAATAATVASAAPVVSAPSVAPTAPAAPVVAAPEPIGAPAPRVDDEVLRIVRELERRIAGIEQRLVQTAEGRERIERQIVAQTEELRVQRAAIARTQRVLRTLARPEDLATEPTPRGPAGGSN